MAGQQQATQQQGGLPPISANADANNLPLYGQSDEDMQNLQDAQQKVSDALEHRYDNPNWMNVAAGFLKPQLGGFAASLGSAAEALGQNTEEQRNNVLSSSDLKLKLLQNQMMLNANKTVADKIQQWHQDNKDALAMPSDVLANFSKGAPNSPLIAKEQQNYNDQMNRITAKRDAGGNLNAQESKLLGGSDSNPPVNQPVQKPTVGQAQFDLNKTSPDQLAALAQTPDFDQAALERGVHNFADANGNNSIPAPAPKSTVYPPSIPPITDSLFGSNVSDQTKKAHDTLAQSVEQPWQDKYNGAAGVVTGENYTQENAARTNLISLIQSNPELTQKITGLTRSSPVLAALDAGAAASAGGAHVDLALPVSTAMDAGLSDSEKAFKDKLLNLVNQVSQSDAKMNGTIAGKVPQQEYMKSFGSYINPNMSPATLENAAMSSKANFDQKKDWYDQTTKELAKNVDPKSLTPLADVNNNSPIISKINKKYDAVHGLLQQQLQSKINPNGAKP